MKDINNNEDEDLDDEDELENEVQQKRPPVPSNAVNEHRLPANNLPREDRMPARLSNDNNYRVADRERFLPKGGHLRQGRQSENGEEVVEEKKQRRQGHIRNRNVV